MKLREISTILGGANLSNKDKKKKINGIKSYRKLTTNSIESPSIIENKLEYDKFDEDLDEKYLLKKYDIVIYLKKKYKVGIFLGAEKNIVVPNAFIIIRDLDSNYYDPIFLANYLTKNIDSLFEYKGSNNINCEDVKDLELPLFSINKQKTISSLLTHLNRRISTYSNIIENDLILINEALESVTGDTHE